MPSRRTHVKSHHGCAQCKARRIKCDEIYPICRKCIKRGVHCSNDENSTSSISSSRFASPLHSLRNNPAAGPISHSLSSSPVQLSIIQLMHHFAIHTAPTFCDYPFLLPLWQTAIPTLAFANPVLLHCVAALSSMHLAHLCPSSESPTHVQAALYHQDTALKLIRPSISGINAQNASVVFVSASIVSIFDIASHSPLATPLFSSSKTLTSPLPLNPFDDLSNASYNALCDPSPFTPASSTFLTDSNNDTISQLQTIFHLLRGILAIVEVSEDSIRAGPVGSLLREVPPDSASPAAPDIECALDRLAAFCATQEPPRGRVQSDAEGQDGPCMLAVRNLRVAFRNVVTAPRRVSAVLKWAVTIDDGFLSALRRGDEGALVVVGLYGVLFHGLDGYWWTSGWGRALVAAVEGKVEAGEARELMSWASRKVWCDGP